MRGSPGRTGITPAHAGKTRKALNDAAPEWDHPRACGENTRKEDFPVFHQGSPPRMRGKHQILPDRSGWRGITPAHAGKTSTIIEGETKIWDHPRACGENTQGRLTGIQVPGSPPRMRGKLKRGVYLVDGRGITPAHAGKTTALRASESRVRDHPRACGEN